MHGSSEVREAMLKYLGAIRDGDADTIASLVSTQPGVLGVGTDPREVWNGHAGLLRAFRTQMQEMGGGFPITSRGVQAFSEGDVGWAFDQPALMLPEGERRFRITTVFHREDGAWKVVHSHASFGAANEEALGKELTV